MTRYQQDDEQNFQDQDGNDDAKNYGSVASAGCIVGTAAAPAFGKRPDVEVKRFWELRRDIRCESTDVEVQRFRKLRREI